MRAAGADDHGSRRRYDDPLQQQYRVVDRPRTVHPIGDDDDRRPRGRCNIARADQLRGEPLDRRRLRDIEGFPRGNRVVLVDEDDRSRDIAARDDVRRQSAELACADNRDFSHPGGLL